MSEVTITIVIKTSDDGVAVSAGDQAGAGGPQPQLIPGTAGMDAAGLPTPSGTPAGAGTEAAPPVPSLSIVEGSAGGAGPVPAAPESLQLPVGAPADVPPVPQEPPPDALEASPRPRGGRRKSS